MSRVYSDLRLKAQADAAGWKERLDRQAISSEVRVAEALFLDPARSAALQARYADLAIIASAGGKAESVPAVRRLFSSLLMESGRPVLVVPPQAKLLLPLRRALVAWRPSREASRALHEAMPLLLQAESVDVLEVHRGDGRKGDAPMPGSDIAAYLARHGLRVRLIVHERKAETVAAAVLHYAEHSGAQLLVAGGYGHSRFREWALGGITRELLRSARLPVLFSH